MINLETNNIERFSIIDIKSKVESIMIKHCKSNQNKELENDLKELLNFLNGEKRKVDNLRTLVFEIVNKL